MMSARCKCEACRKILLDVHNKTMVKTRANQSIPSIPAAPQNARFSAYMHDGQDDTQSCWHRPPVKIWVSNNKRHHKRDKANVSDTKLSRIECRATPRGTTSKLAVWQSCQSIGRRICVVPTAMMYIQRGEVQTITCVIVVRKWPTTAKRPRRNGRRWRVTTRLIKKRCSPFDPPSKVGLRTSCKWLYHDTTRSDW